MLALTAASRLGAGVTPYRDAPPAAHTGGFGEPSCHSCHFDLPLNAPGGTLRLTGVPERYRPGKTYRIEVKLARPGMGAAGFQLAARFASGAAEGEQAGGITVTDARARVASEAGIEYAQHTPEGTALIEPDSTFWLLEWVAPSAAAGPVLFHVVANAANADASEFGDHIYLAQEHSVPAAQERH